MKSRWSGPPIQTKGDQTNIQVMTAIVTAQMRRFGATNEEIEKLREDIKHSGSIEEGFELIRQWFPLDIDFPVLNNCPYNNCTYPGCPQVCEGRKQVKVRNKPHSNGTYNRHKLKV